MSEFEGPQPDPEIPPLVSEETQPESKPAHLAIDVKRHDESEHRGLCFTVQNFNISDSQYAYNIKHVLGFEPAVASTRVDNHDRKVVVMLRHSQLVTEDLAVKLAKSIGNALGFVYGFIDINVGRLR